MKSIVSIIITSYNYGRFLRKAIESALSQHYTKVEVIVVDDGSQDDTREVVYSYVGKIHYIFQENAGVARARNRGVEESTGEFINFLDADDWLQPRKIEIQMRRFAEQPHLDVVTCGWFNVDEDERVINQHVPKWGEDALDHLLRNQSFVPCCALVRRSALEGAGGFCEEPISASWTEDTDLWLRLAATGSRFYMETEALCSWRHHQSVVSRSENIEPSYVGFGKMIDRLEALISPLVSREQVRQFRALYQIAFCARFYARGNHSRAREIFLHLVEAFPEMMQTPGAYLELYLRSQPFDATAYPPSTTQDLEHMQEALLNQMLSELTQGLDRKSRRRCYATACMNIADAAYALGNAALARRFAWEALGNSTGILTQKTCIPPLARAALGPRVGGMIRRMRRGED